MSKSLISGGSLTPSAAFLKVHRRNAVAAQGRRLSSSSPLAVARGFANGLAKNAAVRSRLRLLAGKRSRAESVVERCKALALTRKEKLIEMNLAAVEMITASYQLGKLLLRGIVHQGRPPKGSTGEILLDDIGIDHNISHRCRQLASLPWKPVELYFKHQMPKDKMKWEPVHMSHLLNLACRRKKGMSISKAPLALAGIKGTNAELMKQVEMLYFKRGMRIVDPTYNKGKMWEMVQPWDPKNGYKFFASDLCGKRFGVQEMPCQYLYRYPDNSIDVEVFDPPYVPGAHADVPGFAFGKYNAAGTTRNFTPSQIKELFRGGIQEAFRILKPGGILCVKCQDQTYHHIKWWQTDHIKALAEGVGFEACDKGLLLQNGTPDTRRTQYAKGRGKGKVQTRGIQKFLRMNYSILWIFRKP